MSEKAELAESLDITSFETITVLAGKVAGKVQLCPDTNPALRDQNCREWQDFQTSATSVRSQPIPGTILVPEL